MVKKTGSHKAGTGTGCFGQPDSQTSDRPRSTRSEASGGLVAGVPWAAIRPARRRNGRRQICREPNVRAQSLTWGAGAPSNMQWKNAFGTADGISGSARPDNLLSLVGILLVQSQVNEVIKELKRRLRLLWSSRSWI